MRLNAIGLDVRGSANPNWKGGPIAKVCEVCGEHYVVKRPQAASRFCSLQCAGVAQRGVAKKTAYAIVQKLCEVCSAPYSVPAAHAHRHHCCGQECSAVRRSRVYRGEKSANWHGGLSRLPYTHDFRSISLDVIARAGCVCQNPACRGGDERMTTHHIDYDKQNNADENLICVCSACNSRANVDRPRWMAFYQHLARGGVLA